MVARDTHAKSGRIGVLDIGSNSIRLVIYDIFGAAFTPIYNEKVLAGLGRSLRETGRLNPHGKGQARQALMRFKRIADAQNVDRLMIGATAALREAKDASAFLAQIKADTGLTIEPISGPEEARISALGLLAAMPKADGIAADLGGASLELIRVGGGQPGAGLSLPIGPFQMLGHDLRETEFNPKTLRAAITTALSNSDFNALNPKGETLYLIGGAWRNLAAIHQDRTDYPLRTLQSYRLSTKEARSLSRWAFGPGREDVMRWPDISSKRSETLPYGALLLDVMIDIMQPSKIIISATGLREGLIYSAITPAQRARDALHDGCQDLAKGNLSAEGFAAPLCDFLRAASASFPRHFEADMEERVRYAACLLVGIGKGRHPTYRAELVFEEILYAPIAGLSHELRAYLALILFRSFTNQSRTPNEAAIKALLSPAARRAATIYGLAIRLAVVASGRSADLLPAFTLTVEDNKAALSVRGDAKMLQTARVNHRVTKLNAALKSKTAGWRVSSL
ncbi:Ppx/GppA family phosphatase [Fretibacter rubidus]|uniref:Ppx/GppA phosphatase family protein n=1 Tax=Fretibacter rubidus TaxID=570162 RepID=UPI00352A770B